MDIMFMESDGWIERDFVISGSDNDINIVRASLDNWAKSL